MLGLWPKAPWRHYVCAFRESLNMWAVWLPGSHVEVGDYGTLESYCFQKKGSIKEFIELEPKQIRKKKMDIFLQLGKFNQFCGTAAASANQPMAGSVSASLDVSASRGVFLRVDGLTETEFVTPIPIQRKLDEAVRKQGLPWKNEWFLVNRVVSADSFAILAAQERRTALLLQGSVEALQALNVGKINSGASLEVVGSTDLNILGARGPVALGLTRIELQGLQSREYGLLSENGVRLHTIRPQDISFPDLEDSI